MDPARTARLQILIAGLLFATGGAAVKSCSFGAWQVAGLRSAIAAVVVLIAVPESRRWPSRATLLVGFAYAATLTLYIAANKMTTAANAIFLQSAAPLYLLFLGPLLLRERTSSRDFVVALMMGLGVAVILSGVETPVRTAPDPVRGNTLAALSGVTWAFTILGLRWAGRGSDAGAAASAVVVGNGLTFCASLFMASTFTLGDTVDWLWLVYLGVAQVGMAYVFVTRATPMLPAVQIALLLMIEPALNPILTWVVHREAPSTASVIGGAIILVAIGFASLNNSRGR